MAGGPRFYYRPYWNEHRFLADYPTRGPFDAALIRARFLAPYPPGTLHANRGLTGRELVDALIDSRGPYVIDPDSAVLRYGGVAALSRASQRLPYMPHAQVLTPPLSLLSFASPRDRLAFSQASAAMQGGAEVLSAPYFSV